MPELVETFEITYDNECSRRTCEEWKNDNGSIRVVIIDKVDFKGPLVYSHLAEIYYLIACRYGYYGTEIIIKFLNDRGNPPSFEKLTCVAGSGFGVRGIQIN